MEDETLEVNVATEEALLAHLQQIHEGPWACACCDNLITKELGWKPRIAFVCNEVGAHRVFIDVACGACVLAGREPPL